MSLKETECKSFEEEILTKKSLAGVCFTKLASVDYAVWSLAKAKAIEAWMNHHGAVTKNMTIKGAFYFQDADDPRVWKSVSHDRTVLHLGGNRFKVIESSLFEAIRNFQN